MPRGIPKGTKLRKTVTHRVQGQKLILEIDLTKFVIQAVTSILKDKSEIEEARRLMDMNVEEEI